MLILVWYSLLPREFDPRFTAWSWRTVSHVDSFGAWTNSPCCLTRESHDSARHVPSGAGFLWLQCSKLWRFPPGCWLTHLISEYVGGRLLVYLGVISSLQFSKRYSFTDFKNVAMRSQFIPGIPAPFLKISHSSKHISSATCVNVCVCVREGGECNCPCNLEAGPFC